MNATVGGSDGLYARGLWATRDLARAPTRVGYVGLFVRLMEACCVNLDALEETMACKVLWLRGFVGVSLGYVSKDPWEVQERVLGVVQRASCRAAVVALLGEQGRFVGQLGVVVEQACAWLNAAEEDADGDGVADGLEREGTTAGTVRRVLALASELLTRVVAVDSSIDTLARMTQCMRVAENKKLVKSGLLGLKLARCHEHGRVMRRAFEQSPVVAALFLQQYGATGGQQIGMMDVKKTATYLVHVSVLVGAYDSLAGWLGLELKRRAATTSEAVPSLDVASLWRAVFPTGGVSKVALSKGLQHSQPLVAHATVVLLDAALGAMERVVRLLGEGCDDEKNELLRSLIEHSKRALPGVQLVIGYHAKIGFDSLRADVPSHTLSGILRVLLRWARLFPDAFVEENVQMERMLLHERVLRLHPANRLEVVRVLTTLNDNKHNDNHNDNTSLASPLSVAGLDVVLKLALREPSAGSELYGACVRLAVGQLVGTNLIPYSNLLLDHDHVGTSTRGGDTTASVWITNVCKVGAASEDAALTSSDAVVDFFVEALKAAMKRPMAYVDVIERACSVNDSVPSEYVGPLLVCVVEKMCRILKSKAKDERYKHDVVSFVHGVVRDTIGTSKVPWMYASLIGHVVEVEFPAAAVADGGADLGRTTTTAAKRSREAPSLSTTKLRSVLVEQSGVSHASIFDWLIQLHTEARRLSSATGTGTGTGLLASSKKARDAFGGDEDPSIGLMDAEALMEGLAQAKDAPSKYRRRLQLAMMAPSLEALLVGTHFQRAEVDVEDAEDDVVDLAAANPSGPATSAAPSLQAVREAFVAPVVQFFASKDTHVPDTAVVGDARHFARLCGLSSDTVACVLGGATESAVLELAAPLLRLKENSKPSNPSKAGDRCYCNASVADKLRVLGAVVAWASQSATSPSSPGQGLKRPSDALAAFACEAVIVAISFMRTEGTSREQAMALIESAGDVVSEFGKSARGLEAFGRMLTAWSNSFVPGVMGRAGQRVETTRCLRRFSAALVPDAGVAFAAGALAGTVFDDVCSLFLELITKDFVQQTLRSDDPLVTPPAYSANRMPLESIVSCANRGTMTRNTFTYGIESRPAAGMHKTEMCELLETMLDIIGALEQDLADETVARFAASFDKAESALLKYLMATYGASLSRADMATWSLVRVLNVRLWRRRRASGDMTDPADLADVERDSDEEMMMSIMHGPIASDLRYVWGERVQGLDASNRPPDAVSVLGSVLPLRCAMTVVDFPEWRHLVASDRLPDSVEPEEAPPEHVMSYEAAGYDPAFFLPMCLSALSALSDTDTGATVPSTASQSVVSLVSDTAALPLIIRCLGSADACMRAAAYECLALIERHAPPLFREGSRDVSRLRFLLDWVRQSTLAPLHRFPSIHAVFAAEAAHVLFQPASEAYPLATKHMCKYAAMDLTRIISVGASKGKDPQQHQGWTRRLLVCGLRSSADVYLYTKAHVFELSMALAASRQQPNRDLAVMLVHQAASIPKAARVITESCGALGWLAQTILEQRQRCDRGEDIGLLDLLERAWRNMSSWKGVIERGNGRMRAAARHDLRLATRRLTG